MAGIGLVAGTVFQDIPSLRALREEEIPTEFGTATVLISEDFVYIPRHGTSRNRHILPHRINHPANMQALKELGVTKIIGVYSTGSLKRDIPPGSIVIPDDFILVYPSPTIYHDRSIHISPVLDEDLRAFLIAAAERCGIPVTTRGIYWQVQGPRLETKAEIRMMATFADIVGMNMASEAVVAGELGIPYTGICSVDNYGQGLEARPLTSDIIAEGARRNADAVLRIVMSFIRGR